MYELKRNWKGIYEQICWYRNLVLRKKNLPGRGLTKVRNSDPEKTGLELEIASEVNQVLDCNAVSQANK